MQRTARWSVSTLILAVLVLTTAAVAGADAVTLGDGVVVDAARGVAYVSGVEGKIEAVELSRGKVVWASEMPAKPLAAADDLIIAQAEPAAAGSLEIVSFDAASGKPGRVRTSVEIPKHVKAGLRDTPGKSFRAAARMDGGDLVVSWLATGASRDEVMRGYLPSASEGSDPVATSGAAESVAGAVQVDLDSGAAVEAQAPVASAAAIEMLPGTAVPGASGSLFASADGRHVLASERQAGDDPFASYRWTIYARDTGEQLGEVTSISSVSKFVVAGDKLVYLAQRSIRPQGTKLLDEPMQLRAFDLAQGGLTWSREVTDPSFRGPFPH